MYQIGETVWVIIDKFDTPKECIVVAVFTQNNRLIYNVLYKYRNFRISNVDVYPTQIIANIYWAICIQEDYYKTLEFPDLFLTDDYERAQYKAKKILSNYVDEIPHLLLKYL